MNTFPPSQTSFYTTSLPDMLEPPTHHQEPDSEGQWSRGYTNDNRFTQMRDPLSESYDYAPPPLSTNLPSPSVSPVLPNSPSDGFPNIEALDLSPQSPFGTTPSLSPQPSWKTAPSPQLLLPPTRNNLLRTSSFNRGSLLPPDGIKRSTSRSAPQSPNLGYYDTNVTFAFPSMYQDSPSDYHHVNHSPASPDAPPSLPEPFRHIDHLHSPPIILEYVELPENILPVSPDSIHNAGLPSRHSAIQPPELFHYFSSPAPEVQSLGLPTGPPSAYTTSVPPHHTFTFVDTDMKASLGATRKPEHIRKTLMSQYSDWQDGKVMKMFSKAAKDKVSTIAGLRASLQRRKAEAKFTCEHCSSTFTRKHNLNNHLKSHYGITDLECKYCGHPFTTIPVKKRHEDTCKENPDRKASTSAKKTPAV